MTVVEYLIEKLARNNAHDAFGIPGGVILDLVYAMDGSKEITPRLSYHEQGAALEACGYAQVNHSLGVAYATRGPGFTNLVTGIADAYADSIPVLFITGHSGLIVGHKQRYEKDQELDAVSMVSKITKYASTIDNENEAKEKIDYAIKVAMEDRKGPVLLDFSSSVWQRDISLKCIGEVNYSPLVGPSEMYNLISGFLSDARKPVILVGDGIRQAGVIDQIKPFIEFLDVPILSSRCSQDVGSSYSNYFGYIGSHGLRYSNMILTQSDRIISIGNRMGFPLESRSYCKSLQNKKILRIEIDDGELLRIIPNCINIKCNLRFIAQKNDDVFWEKKDYSEWKSYCEKTRAVFFNADCNQIVLTLADLFRNNDRLCVVDVGNTEFWASRAYELSKSQFRVIYSKSFGTLGCGIPKAIGAYYKTKKPVLCVVGDQGLQLNIQELQMISLERIPIAVFVVNNSSSGMIRDRESKYHKFLHTTVQSGYKPLNVKKIADAYDIPFKEYDESLDLFENGPIIIDYKCDENIRLEPFLPEGHMMDNMSPDIDKSKGEI